MNQTCRHLLSRVDKWTWRLVVRISNWLWPYPIINIKSGQVVVVIGRPGTGKSTLLRWLLRSAQSVIVYDSKYDPDEWPVQPNFAIIEKVSELSSHPRVVLRCRTEWLDDKEGWKVQGHPWSIALEHPMQRGNTIAVFDEALRTWPIGGAHPGCYRLIQQGRSFKVTTIIGSQLANNINTRPLRMASHIMVLGPCKNAAELNNLLRANSIDTAPLLSMKKHEIAWWSEDMDQWVIFRKIKMKKSDYNQLRQRRVAGSLHGNFWLSYINWPVVLLASLIIITDILLFSANSPLATIIAGQAPFALVGYIIARNWQSKNWELLVESGVWEPDLAEEDNPVEITTKRRPVKNFRVV